MYRAVALALERANIDYDDAASVRSILGTLHIEMPGGALLLNGEDVTLAIRTPRMSAASSRVAADPNVRSFLVAEQRSIAQDRNMVCEGRDQGTVAFPNAVCKFFLTASPEARAHRRFQEMIHRGLKVTLNQVLQEQEERDLRDSSRDVAPLVPATDAIVIDTSALNAEQVLNRLEEEVRQCLPG